MIPKKLHLFWAGEPMSFLHTLTVDSFHRYNPDWEIILYLPREKLPAISQSPAYTGEDYSERLGLLPYVTMKTINLTEYGVPDRLNGAQVSDIVAYNVLHREGGVYCDFDVLWLRPWSDIEKIQLIGQPGIGTFEQHYWNSIVSFSEGYKGWHSVGVLACNPGDSFYFEITQLQRMARQPYHYESFGSAMLNTFYPRIETVWQKYPDVIAIKYETFYPYHVWKLNKLFKETDLSLITDDTLAVHWFNGHPLAKEYINSGTYPDCSMTEILTKEFYIV